MTSHHPRCLLTPDLETQRTSTLTDTLPSLAEGLSKAEGRPSETWFQTKQYCLLSGLSGPRAAVATEDLKPGPLSFLWLAHQVLLFIFNVLKIKPFSLFALSPLPQVSLTPAWCSAWINKRNPSHLFYKAFLQPLSHLPWEVSIMTCPANKKPEVENIKYITRVNSPGNRARRQPFHTLTNTLLSLSKEVSR